ncbi:MAG: bifunctional phosphoribosyl-AMP cyclohydrolase/phosphoribosyl-ATP diphosphatase HisIE [Flavobacteriales bacterium]|nr:bifunctional phosphoribosyl-AMP cyclohydrolase/phosphoribosyl-ATP diphosphatase HisIE [Flavobacteriales bacterium]
MQIDFTKNDGLVPVIVQNTLTLQVLMLGYMNKEAFDLTKEKGLVTFYSRSKQRIWMKGETSNNTLKVDDIQLDCDKDTLLIKATPNGVTCHTGSTSCFKEETSKGFVYELEKTIHDRIDQDDPKSYTNKLFKRGVNKVAQKVGEEAVEVVIEAKDNNDDLFKNEVADLTYHLLILLKYKNISFEEIEKILKERSSK